MYRISRHRVPGGLLRPQRRCVSVKAATTPNPASVMFAPEGKEVLGSSLRPRVYRGLEDCADSMLAATLFRVRGVHEVMLGASHVTVTKVEDAEWQHVSPNVELVMSQFFASELPTVAPGLVDEPAPEGEDDPIVAAIREVLDERVSEAVQEDGGDVAFSSFDVMSGTVWLEMKGSCKGCPSSSGTLKDFIFKALSHFVPEVKAVKATTEAPEHAATPGTAPGQDPFNIGDRVRWAGKGGVVIAVDAEGDPTLRLDMQPEEPVATFAKFCQHEIKYDVAPGSAPSSGTRVALRVILGDGGAAMDSWEQVDTAVRGMDSEAVTAALKRGGWEVPPDSKALQDALLGNLATLFA
mmetsp:Transcript_15914/g.35432  ORF Transcript_15914/g.35432 Transcript_15914/m.35432 type:complete len:352 (-) Transcript_15914:33-1088(-)